MHKTTMSSEKNHTHRVVNDASNNYSIPGCVFIATGTCLPSHFLENMGGGDTHTDTQQGDLISLILFIYFFFKIRKVG
jgi:hypothetical protein